MPALQSNTSQVSFSIGVGVSGVTQAHIVFSQRPEIQLLISLSFVFENEQFKVTDLFPVLLPKAQNWGQARQYLCNHARCVAEKKSCKLRQFFSRFSYNKSHIAGATCEVQNLCILVCNPLQQKLLHKSLRIAITHDRLTLVEVLQVLQKKLSCFQLF